MVLHQDAEALGALRDDVLQAGAAVGRGRLRRRLHVGDARLQPDQLAAALLEVARGVGARRADHEAQGQEHQQQK